MVRHHRVHVAGNARHQKKRNDAVSKRRKRAESDQRVHVRRAAEKAFRAADKKCLIDHHHDARKEHLHNSLRDHIAVEKRRNRPAEHHVPHGKIHQCREKSQRRDKPTTQHRRLMILQKRRVRRNVNVLFLLVLDRRVVARTFNGSNDRRRIGIAFDAHRVRQQADRAVVHTLDLLHGLLHASNASRATHARDNILLHPFTSVQK